MKECYKRRFVKRHFERSDIRKIFKIPKDELFVDFKLVLRTLKNYNKEKGDI